MGRLKRLSSRLGSGFGHGVARVWEGLSEGWAELRQRSSGALTFFTRQSADPHATVTRGNPETPGPSRDFPGWALLPAETWETAHNLIIRLEVPGVRHADLQVWVEGPRLHVRGEKHAHPGNAEQHYHLMERAYGQFERVVDLPAKVVGSAAEISLVEGVVTIILPKSEVSPPLLHS